MRPVVKMILLFIIIIIASALFFVILDDDDTKSAPVNSGVTAEINNSRLVK